MVKFKKLWLFERSEFQRFLNFIIVQFIAEIRPGSEIIYMNIYSLSFGPSTSLHQSLPISAQLISSPFLS